MAIHKTCDGITRRDMLRVGTLGGAALTLPSYLQLLQAGELKKPRAKAAIFVNLPGGPSHLDTFDMKPESPSEYRGEFNPIDTKVSGLSICEHLPNLAQAADKFVLLRGVSHTLAAHQLGQEYIGTGNRPLPSLDYPSYGSVASKELASPQDLPPFVAIPSTAHGAGFLGVKHAPLQTGATPVPGKPFAVRGLSIGRSLTMQEVDRRQSLLKDLDKTFTSVEQENQLLDGLDRFGQQAYDIITSKRARTAFDISKEKESFSSQFGKTAFGGSCLLAVRLIESGVPFVTLTNGGWDTHRDNWTRLKEKQLPPFDEGLAALFNGLEQKGLLESTAVFVTGEFGRTPKINTQRNGRDHYPRNMFMMMAGAGMQGGRVIGASDAKGEGPQGDGISPDDVAASFYHCLGIDHTKEYHSSTGRPITVVRNGNVINELFA